jgi:hypothetical protein
LLRNKRGSPGFTNAPLHTSYPLSLPYSTVPATPLTPTLKHIEEILLPTEEKETREMGYRVRYPRDNEINKEVKILYSSGNKQVLYIYVCVYICLYVF